MFCKLPFSFYSIFLLFAVFLSSYNLNAVIIPPGTKLHSNQHLRINNSAEPSTLVPFLAVGTVEAKILHDLFETLTEVSQNGKSRLGLADEIYHNNNYKTWIVTLRKNARWSNGNPVKAEDFIYSLQQLVDPKTGAINSSYLQEFKILNAAEIIKGDKNPETLGIKALNDYQIEFTLTESLPYFDKILAHTTMMPIHKKTIEHYGHKIPWQNLLSNGAYKIDKWIAGERLELIRNPYYWNSKNVKIDKVTYFFIQSPVTALVRYKNDEINITSIEGLVSSVFEQKVRNNAKLKQELHNNPKLCTSIYQFNFQHPVLQKINVRRALKLTIEQQVIADKILGQGEVAAYSYVPPYTDGIDVTKPEWKTWSQERRNIKARELLASEGYNEKKPLQLTLLYNESAFHKKIALAAIAFWKNNLKFVDIQLKSIEWKLFIDEKRYGNFEIARSRWCADYNEPTNFLSAYLSNNSNNDSKYKNKQFDDIMLKAAITKNEDERMQYYKKAEEILDTDAAMITLVHDAKPTLIKSYVKGQVNTPLIYYHYSKNFYIIDY